MYLEWPDPKDPGNWGLYLIALLPVAIPVGLVLLLLFLLGWLLGRRGIP